MTDFNTITAQLTEKERTKLVILTEANDSEELFRVIASMQQDAFWQGYAKAKQQIKDKSKSVHKKNEHYYMIKSNDLY